MPSTVPVAVLSLPSPPGRPTGAPPPADRPPLPLARAAHDLRAGERRLLIGAIAGAHLVGLWALFQVEAVRQAVREAVPVMVDFIPPEAPPRPAPPPPPSPRPPAPAPRPQPVIAAAPTPVPAPAPFVVPAPEPAPAPPVVMAAPSPPAPPAPVPPPAPPAPKLLPATAVSYLVQPPIEVPMASRRLGESGTVLLRVLVDAAGLPRQVSLHKSSGFPRLDEQAQQAMRRARFKPQTDNGQPIEWVVIAPLQYEVE